MPAEKSNHHQNNSERNSRPDSRHRDWILATLEHYETLLTGYVGRILGDIEPARDVVQHAFLKLCGQNQAALGGKERAWLYAVCRNRAFDLLRRKNTESLETGDVAFVGAFVGHEPDPAQTAEEQDLHQHIAAVVAELPESQRDVLRLWQAGMSYREISDVCERSEANVRVLMHRALKTLRTDARLRRWLSVSSETIRQTDALR